MHEIKCDYLNGRIELFDICKYNHHLTINNKAICQQQRLKEREKKPSLSSKLEENGSLAFTGL